ncbi:DUF2802 domain-containing protein [Thiorhodococcus mannitoliphagus]|uniref:DUF2802 domain-containing protein n=1 Tax=Thiorhodococcus mannitoliphagus TaxID=329406 RepID=A0A6P1DT75_9GAMM|nr:DUF2802 domain-containing protein [Thiorhodococcus mannitoliphagus]NEX20141.1 DUF2802 domain-containing protein [Thiorhodococcus mannitoliphagus]
MSAESIVDKLPFEPLWIAFCVLFLVLLIGMLLVVRVLRSNRRLRSQLKEVRSEQQRQSTSLLALHGAMKVIAEDVIKHGQLQSNVSRTLERLSDQQSELRLRDVEEGLYSQAIALVHQGKRRDEVRKLCALTESEVDLLFSLHGQGGESQPWG